MSTLHLVDPDLLDTLDMLPKFDFDETLIKVIRNQMDEMMAAMPESEDTAVIRESRKIPGINSPEVGVLIYRPADQQGPLPAILHIHGGGYVIGCALMGDATARHKVKELNCVFVSVDYRLAPETQHPGPVEDCYSALRFLFDHADALQIDPTRIGVAGESAGGGLAASLALLARDRGEVKLAFQHLIAPMIDDRTTASPDPHPYTGEFCWTRKSNHFGWSSLLGGEPGSLDISSYAAAARATDLTSLPPAYIAVGALDLFLDEDLDYALRLTRAGVPTAFHLYPGAYHGFEMSAASYVTGKAKEDAYSALRRVLHPKA